MVSQEDEVATLRAELERERASHNRTKRAAELAATELQHANAELGAIFTSLPDLFLRLDARGMVVDHKGGGANALDHLLTPDPWNVPLRECVVMGAAPALERAVAELSSTSLSRVEYVLSSAGDTRYFEARAVRLPNQDTLIVVTEISERMRAHEALVHEQNERARELQGFASHDLLAPLGNIESITKWLIEDIEDVEATRGHLELLEKRVAYMRRLMRGMLDYAQVGARDVTGAEDVDVEALARDIIEVAGAQGFAYETVNLPRLTTGRVPLERVLQNLVSNAVKYHDAPPGRIAITCRDDGDFLTFRVIDDGPGIPEKHHERAFMLFRRLAPNHQEGAGVGLAIVRRLVRRVGGDVRLEANSPRGLMVRFTWPKRWPSDRSGNAPDTDA